jgi:hypothetical protein
MLNRISVKKSLNESFNLNVVLFFKITKMKPHVLQPHLNSQNFA